MQKREMQEEAKEAELHMHMWVQLSLSPRGLSLTLVALVASSDFQLGKGHDRIRRMSSCSDVFFSSHDFLIYFAQINLLHYVSH